MSGKRRLTKSIKGLDVTKQDKPRTVRGILGNVISGVQVVEVTTRPGYVWVRLRDQQSEIIQAFNDNVSPVYDLPVFVTRDSDDPTRYIVIGRDTAQYQNWGAGSAYLPRHANQHSFSDDAGAAGDVVWVYGRQFMPMLAYPSGSSGAGNVIISPYTYFAQSQNWIYSGGTGTASIVAYKPTGSNARVVLVYMDVDGNPQLSPGSYFAETITGTSQVIQYLPDLPNNSKPIAAVRLVSGTSIINWSNIYDVRQFYNDSVIAPTSTPSLGIAVYDDHVFVATGTVLDFTSNISVAVTGSSVFISSTGGGGGSGTGTATLGIRAYRTTDVAIPNGLTGTVIPFTNEEYDDDNMHSGSSSQLFCNTAGYYGIVGNVEWQANSSGERRLFIRLNGNNSTIVGASVNNNGGAAVSLIQNVTSVWYLNVGDYVELLAAHNSTTTPLYIVGGVLTNKFPIFMMQRFGDVGSTIINTGTVVNNNTYNTYNSNNVLPIFDDSVFKVTGTAISFDSNLSVAITGTVAFISAAAGAGGGLSALPIYDDHVFKASGTSIDFMDNLNVVSSGTAIYVSSPFSTGSVSIVGARVTRNLGNLTFTGSTSGYVIPFTDERWDNGGLFNNSSGVSTRFTVSEQGYYYIAGSAFFSHDLVSPGTLRSLSIRLNADTSTPIAVTQVPDSSSLGYPGNQVLGVSCVQYLNSGDYVQLIANTDKSGTSYPSDTIYALDNYSPEFTIHKLDNINLVSTGTVNINTFNSINVLPIHEDNSFKVTGSSISFNKYLDVTASGTTAQVDVSIPDGIFASGSHTHPAGAAAINVFENSIFKTTGTSISFDAGLSVGVTGTTAYVSVTGSSGGGTKYLWFHFGLGYDTNQGDFSVVSSSTAGTIRRTSFFMPPDFSSLIEAKVILIPLADSTTQNFDVNTDFGAIGEVYNFHSNSITTPALTLTNTQLYGVDVSMALSGTAAGDFVGLAIDKNVNEALVYLGVYIAYN